MSETSLYLSRARLRRDAPAAALRALLVPRGESARTAAGHRLVWTLFGDTPDRERDFLWREADAGLFYLLSRRLPEDRHGLFELDEPKPFAPVLAPGDRLAFSLRANATVARGGSAERRGKPCDVVMDALRAVPSGGERAAARSGVIEAAGTAWLNARAEKSGFTIPGCARVTAYRTLRLDRPGSPARIGVLDFEGELEVRDPVVFVTAIAQGFGRAKAFGCGLMLVRRV